MKTSDFIIFISIVLVVYIATNYYIFARGWQAIPKTTAWKYGYTITFLVLALSYWVGRIVERIDVCQASDVCIWIGSFWLAYMAYLFFGALFVDILRGLASLTGTMPAIIQDNIQKAKQVTAIVVLAISTVVIAAGYVNACIPRIRHLSLDIPARSAKMDTFHAVLATDIHLGTIISNSRLERLVNEINNLDPDIVLFAGDIVDEDITPVIENNMGDILRKIRSRYGVYAVTGNHEYIGGVEAAIQYMNDHDITVIQDQAVKINENIYLVGRKDRTANRFSGDERKPLQAIMQNVPGNLPVILMDHQPFKLQEAMTNGVDLQLSGHTHHGQMWPFNYITSAIYELSTGYLKKDATHYYVSSGYGTWGPPVRTGNRPEIVDIRITFTR